MANTPNIDLVKPAGTDHALVSVINQNSDKIDAAVGALNDNIAKKLLAYTITAGQTRVPTSGTDSNITASHRVLNEFVNHTADITWKTYDGYFTLSAGCPAMTIILGLPG